MAERARQAAEFRFAAIAKSQPSSTAPDAGVVPADTLLGPAVDLDVGGVQIDGRVPGHQRRPTIDLDASDIEVYGRTKVGVGWNYAGVRSGRVHLASWAQAELPLAMDLMAGNDDVRPPATELLRRALAVLPTQVCGRPRVRADAGYFDAALAHGAVKLGCDFAIAAKRNSAAWRAFSAIPEATWQDARGMEDAQVAACDYAPVAGPTRPTRLCAGSKSRSSSSVLTRGPAGAGPYRKTSSRSPSVAPLITSGPSASSSPTSPPTTRTSSDWKPGSGTGPPSRNASVKASTAPA